MHVRVCVYGQCMPYFGFISSSEQFHIMFYLYAVLASLDLKSKQVSYLRTCKCDQRLQCLSIDPSQPAEIRRLRHEKVKFVSCGEEHTAVLTQVTNYNNIII